MIRRWGACNHQFINIKRNVRRGAIVAKPISPRQTGRRFMCALAYPYGVTRRGMTQRISASLLPLDGWSRPNVTAACLIHERKLVWALCTVSIDGGDLLEMSKISRLRPGVARRRFPVTFGCSIGCKKRRMAPACPWRSQDLYLAHFASHLFLGCNYIQFGDNEIIEEKWYWSVKLGCPGVLQDTHCSHLTMDLEREPLRQLV